LPSLAKLAAVLMVSSAPKSCAPPKPSTASEKAVAWASKLLPATVKSMVKSSVLSPSRSSENWLRWVKSTGVFRAPL